MNKEQAREAALKAYQIVEERREDRRKAGLTPSIFTGALIEGDTAGARFLNRLAQDGVIDFARNPLLADEEFRQEFMVELNSIHAQQDLAGENVHIGASGRDAALDITQIVTAAAALKPAAALPARYTHDIHGAAAVGGLEVGYSETIGTLRPQQEDAFFIGVADGRFSDPSSTPEMLQRELTRFADERIGASPEALHQGSTALLTHYSREGKISIAGLGDSRAVAFVKASDGTITPFRLTYDHKPSDYLEGARIEAEGGFVAYARGGGPLRVNGRLEPSRSLGDKAIMGKIIADQNGDPILDAKNLVIPVVRDVLGNLIRPEVNLLGNLILLPDIVLCSDAQGNHCYVRRPLPPGVRNPNNDLITTDVYGNQINLPDGAIDAGGDPIPVQDSDGNDCLFVATDKGGVVALAINGATGLPFVPFTDNLGRRILDPDPTVQTIIERPLITPQASIYQYDVAELRRQIAVDDPGAQVFLMASCDGLYEGLNERDYALLLQKWYEASPEGGALRKEFEGNVSTYIQSCALAGLQGEADQSTDNITLTFTDITRPPQQDVLIGVFDGHGGREISKAAAVDIAMSCIDQRQPRIICAPEGDTIQLSGLAGGQERWGVPSGRVADLARKAAVVTGEEREKVERRHESVAEKKDRLTAAAQILAQMMSDDVPTEQFQAKFEDLGLATEIPSLTQGKVITFRNQCSAASQVNYEAAAQFAGLDAEGNGWYGQHHEPETPQEWQHFFAQQLMFATFDDKALLTTRGFKARLDAFMGGAFVDMGVVAANPNRDTFGLCARGKYKKMQEEKPALAALDYPSFLQLLEIVMRKKEQDHEAEHGAGTMRPDHYELEFKAFVNMEGTDVALAVRMAEKLREGGLLRDVIDKLGDRRLEPEDLFGDVTKAEGEAARVIIHGLRSALLAKKVTKNSASTKKYEEMVRGGPFQGRAFDDDTITWPQEVPVSELTKPGQDYFSVDAAHLLVEEVTGGTVTQEKSGFPVFTYDGQVGLHNLFTQVQNSSRASREEDDIPLVSFARIAGLKTGPSAEEDLDVRVVATKFGTSMEFTSAADNAFADVKAETEKRYEEFLIYQRRMKNLEVVADIMRAKIGVGHAESLEVDATADEVAQLREKLSNLEKIIKKCKIGDDEELDARMEKVAALAEEYSKGDRLEFGPSGDLLKAMNDDKWLRKTYDDDGTKWAAIQTRLAAAAVPPGAAVPDSEVLTEFRKAYQPADLRIADAIADAKDTKSSAAERQAARHFAAQAATRTVAKEAQRHMEETQLSMQISQVDRATMAVRAKEFGLSVKEQDKKEIDALLSHPWQQSSCRNGGLLIHRPKGTTDVALVTFTEPQDRAVRPTDKNIAWVYSGSGDYYLKAIRVDDPNKPVRYMKDGKMISEKLPKGTVVISEGLCELDHKTGRYGPEISPVASTLGTSELTRHFEGKGLSHKQAVEEANALRAVYEGFQIRATSISQDGERHVAIMHGGKSTEDLNLGKQTLPTRAASKSGVAGIETSFDGDTDGQVRYSELLPVCSSDRARTPLGRIVMEVKHEGTKADGTPILTVDRTKLLLETQGLDGKPKLISLSTLETTDAAGKKIPLSVADALKLHLGTRVTDEDASLIAAKAAALAETARVGVTYRTSTSSEPTFAVVQDVPPAKSCRATRVTDLATEVAKLDVFSTKAAVADTGRGGRGGGPSRSKAKLPHTMPAGASVAAPSV